jgi:hypothetical protein
MNRVAEAASVLSLLNIRQQIYDLFFDRLIFFLAPAIYEFLLTRIYDVFIFI